MATLAANATTGNITSVAASTTTVTLLALNNARKGLSIYNNGAGTMYVAYATGATSSMYSLQLSPGAYYESNVDYVGIMTAVWSSASGNALVTEFS